MNQTIECTPFRIGDHGEIRLARRDEGGDGARYIHVSGAPEDHAAVIVALRAACAVPLPVGRYVVGWHLLEGAMQTGKRVTAMRFAD